MTLFDPHLRPLRRARAAAMGGDQFLHQRAFDDCLERLGAIQRRFERALLFGPELPGWVERLRSFGCPTVVVAEPGFHGPPPTAPDLCISVGGLDLIEELPATLAAIRHLLAPGGLFIGAFAGGDSLPALRGAMQAADRASGGVAMPHVHPRIDPASFSGLLSGAGFVDPVIDIDRVSVRYRSLDALVRDLRGMAATNMLAERPRRPILRAGREAARAAFLDGASERIERFDLVHFIAWSPPQL
ncbi:MAG: SAM-dependent methyltransferase [Sphingomicrobium sp.]